MSKARGRHVVLSQTATFDKEGCLRVVIETPKGSHNKYDYDPECDCFELATALPEGMTFPYDFGFIPSTLGEDGDPLDVLVLMDFPVMPGCLLNARLIGAIRAEQKEKGKDWIRNDRLIAIAQHARTHTGVHKLKDLRPHLLQEITAFFQDYNKEHGKKFKPVGDCDAELALDLVRRGIQKYKKKK
jgi:inorganic pyrophosphatase